MSKESMSNLKKDYQIHRMRISAIEKQISDLESELEKMSDESGFPSELHNNLYIPKGMGDMLQNRYNLSDDELDFLLGEDGELADYNYYADMNDFGWTDFS